MAVNRSNHYAERLSNLLSRTFEEVDADLIEDPNTFAEMDKTGIIQEKIKTLDDFENVIGTTEYLMGKDDAVAALFRHSWLRLDDGRSLEDWRSDLTKNAKDKLFDVSEFETAFPISKEEQFRTRRGERRTRRVARTRAGTFAAAVV